MLLTHRETRILEHLIAYRNGVQIEMFENILQVSRRTVYREIARLEESLKPFGIQIIKPRGAGYQLVATQDQIAELKESLTENKDPAFDIQERQRAVAVQLFLADEPITMDTLAQEMVVSVNTIQSDLNAIERSISDFGIQVNRIPASGIKIEATEKERRQMASGLIYGNVPELDFFRYINTLSKEHLERSDNYFLHMISPTSLFAVFQSFEKATNNAFDEVTDNQMQQVITILALSIDRIKAGHTHEQAIDAKQISKQSLNRAHSLMGEVSTATGLSFDLNERHFLARQLEGLNFKTSPTIFIESFNVNLSYKVKELIRLTTIYSRNDYRQDERLFYDLVTHLSAALKRPTSMMEPVNVSVLDSVIEQYQVLYKAVKRAYNESFGDVNLAKDELAYVLIHFATSYERHPRSMQDVRLLIICSSGIGTSKILENRVQKYVPEVTQTEIARTSQLDEIDYGQFELIISTVYIPDFPQNYRVVSPLLLEEDINMIREEIGQLVDQEMSLKSFEDSKVSSEDVVDFNQLYQHVSQAKHVMDQFEMRSVQSEVTIEQTIVKILQTVDDRIIQDVHKVAEYIIQRYLMAPIGIPDTQMALFHSSNEWVNKPLFKIYNLDQAFSIPGMNGEAIELERILLLLAPNPIEEASEHLLGIISSSIIESDLNTKTYNQGNQRDIYQLLSTLFVKDIRQID